MKKTILLIIILLLVHNIYGQTITIIGDTSFCRGQSVTLTANPIGSAYQWIKNGSQTVGTLRDYTADSSGRYKVIITVSGVPQVTREVLITVFVKPVAAIFADTNNVCSGTLVHFTSNVNNGTQPYKYFWDYGDGGRDTGLATRDHHLISFGCSTMGMSPTLIVEDANGCRDTASVLLNVKQAPDVQVSDSDFLNSFNNCIRNPTSTNSEYHITLNNASPNLGCIVKYMVDWDDGQIQTNLTNDSFPLHHTYLSLGEFQMVITAIGNNGCENSKRYTIGNQSEAKIGLNVSTTSGCGETPITITVGNWKNNSPGTKYILSYGDGNFSSYDHPIVPNDTIFTVTHKYLTSSCPDSAAFKLQILAKNTCRPNSVSSPIEIYTQPKAKFSVQNPSCINTNVFFTNQTTLGYYSGCSSATGYKWDFGDPASGGNNNSTTFDGQHTYNSIGTYTVILSAYNNCGTSYDTLKLCITDPVIPSFDIDTSKGCVPLAVNVTNTTPDGSCPNKFKWRVLYESEFCETDSSWSFDHSTDTSISPTFIFKKAGIYTIEQTIFNPCNYAGKSVTKTVDVRKPLSFVLPPDDSICAFGDFDPYVVLPDCDTSSKTYFWDFGTFGTNTTADPPKITFPDTLVYPIILTVSNGCSPSFTDTQYVTVRPPVKIIHNPDITACSGDSVSSVVFQSIPAGASFAWTNSDSSIGLDSSGSGFIPAFVAKDTSTLPVKSMIIVSIQDASCGNPLPDTFYITVLPSLDSSSTDTICQKDLPYLWRNHSLDSTGIYSDTANNSTGCDTIFKLRLTVTPTIRIFDSATACPAQLPYTWPHNQKQYPAADYYYDTTYTPAGCDTIWSLHLMVSDTLRHIDTVEICNNALPYLWHQALYITDTLVSFDTTNMVGCDSISYLRLVVKDTSTGTTRAAICSDSLPYIWNGNSYFTTDSLAIVLPGQNQFGCDSTDILILTVKLPTDSNMYVTLCPRDTPYVWPVNGQSYSTTTNDVVIKRNVAGCDSVITLHLTVNPDTRRDTSATICNNDTLLWRGSKYFFQGSYPFVLLNQFGCDSVITLQLTVLDTSFSEKMDTICNNRLPYIWNNNSYYDSGWHNIRLPGQNYVGCDSVAKLHLFIRDTTATFDTLKICPSQLPYNWEGLVLSGGGDTTKRYINRAGCDSIKLLHLIIKNNSYTTVVKELCPRDIPYFWNNVLYTVSGIYQATLLNRDSCDSVVTLHLTVFDNSRSTTDLVVCRDTFPFIWNSLNISSAGVYKTTLTALDVHTCDSIVTLNVAIKPGSARSENYISICPADTPYVWHGLTFTKSGIDSVKISNGSGCDSTAVIIVTLHNNDTVYYTMQLCPAQFPFDYHGNVFAAPGTYPVHLQTYFGCDSLVYLTLDPGTDSTVTEKDSVCVGRFPYYWHNKTIYNAGIYFDTLTNATGCRTFYTLHLGVVNSPTRIEYVHTCSDKLPFIWHNLPYTISGFYTFTDSISANCDSVLQLALTIGNPDTVSVDTTVCPSQLPFSWNNQIASSDTTLKFISQNLEQCDSTTILNVHVSPVLRDTITVSICSNTFPYLWHSKSYYGAGTYHDTIPLSLGCLRISTLQLLENKISSSDTTALVCKKQTPFTWRSRLYYASAEDSVKLTNYLGCDSVIYLHLHVAEVDTLPIQNAICSSQLPYSFNGHVFTAAGTFDTSFISTVTGCDSVVNRLIVTVSSTLPLPPPVSNSPVCEGTNIQLHDTLITNATYYWSGPKQFTSQVSNPVVLNASQQSAGYYVSVITVNGCQTKDSVFVTIISKPIGGNTNNDSSVCNGVNTGVIRLTGYWGIIREWQYSFDSGRIWTSVPSSNYDTVAYKNLTSVRWFRAVVGKDSCTDVYSDTSIITLLASANIAEAGSPQLLCDADSTTLAGNIPVNNSTGAWTLVLPSPAVNFYNSTLYNTAVTGLQGDVTYQFAWTITGQGACSATSDTVMITNRPAITKADAGTDITICDFPNTKQANLSANLNSLRPYETGQWTLISYPAGSITHTFGNQANPATTFTLDSAGVYTIAWTIKNDIPNGCSPSKSTINITVTRSPVSSFSISESQTCVGENVTVTNNSLNANPNSFTWIWGDLTPNSTFTGGQHSYSISGNYLVRLIAANANCTDTSEIPITVINKVPAQIMVGPGVPCVPYTIHLKAANDTSASRIEWKIFDHNAFPSVSVITGATARYTFNFAGSDSVRLIVYSSNGCRDSSIYKFTVYDIPSVSFSPMAYDTCSHDEVLHFIAAPSQSGTDSLHYTWFVDSVIRGNTNPFSYRFITSPVNPDVVVYHIQALAQNDGQCGDTSLTGIVIIKPLPAIAINVEPSRRQEEPDFTFTFSDTSAAVSVMTYKWFTGDRSAQVREGQRVTYTYSDTGKYTVSLLKTNLYTCTNTDTVQIQILPVRGYIYVPNAMCAGCQAAGLRTFLPLGKGLSEYHLRIYTTWGQLVFQTDSLNRDGSPAVPWDGTWTNGKDVLKGTKLQQNTYIWTIDAKYINKSEWKGMVYPGNPDRVKTGFITIIK